MARSLSRLVVAAAIAVGSATLSLPASACHDLREDGTSRTVACFTSLHAGLSTAIFGPANVYYGLDRRWLPSEWAWPQLLLGGFGTMGGGAAAIMLAATGDDVRHRDLDILWGSGLVVAGGIHGAVATFSLERHHEPASPGADTARWQLPRIAVVPRDGGAMFMASF